MELKKRKKFWSCKELNTAPRKFLKEFNEFKAGLHQLVVPGVHMHPHLLGKQRNKIRIEFCLCMALKCSTYAPQRPCKGNNFLTNGLYTRITKKAILIDENVQYGTLIPS